MERGGPHRYNHHKVLNVVLRIKDQVLRVLKPFSLNLITYSDILIVRVSHNETCPEYSGGLRGHPYVRMAQRKAYG